MRFQRVFAILPRSRVGLGLDVSARGGARAVSARVRDSPSLTRRVVIGRVSEGRVECGVGAC